MPPKKMSIDSKSISTERLTKLVENYDDPMIQSLFKKSKTRGDIINIIKKIKQIKTIINKDGVLVRIYKNWIDEKEAAERIKKFQEIKFESHPVKIYGKEIMQPRQIYGCGDSDIKSHNYSGLKLELHPWIPELKADADRITDEFGFKPNSCLLNEYKTGQQYIGWHSDKEINKEYNNYVFTVSLGGSRKFKLRHKKTKEVIDVILDAGDLCIMAGKCQEIYEHSIPKCANAEYRISETFRCLKITS